MKSSLLISTLFFGTTLAASAQRPPRAAELDRLGFLVGEFRGEVEFQVPGSPPAKAPMNYRAAWELDSAWVVAHYDQSPRNVPLRGMLLYTWDLPKRHYLFYGLANAPMEPSAMRGSFEGARLVFVGDTTKTPAYRETWEPQGPDTLVTTLAYRRQGEWVVGSRAVLVRVKR